MDDIIIDNQPVSVLVDKQGKISLKVYNFGNYFYNLVIKSLLMSVLLSINFCLFVRAGSYDVFGAGEFSVVTGGVLVKIFLCSLALMFVLSFSRTLQNVLLAFVAGIFVMAMLNQFALFNRYTFLSDTIKIYINEPLGEFVYGISDIAAAFIVAFLVFAYLCYASKANLAYLLGTLLILNGYILFSAYMNKNSVSDWVVDYDNHVNGAGKGKKIVNIMLANAASYSYINNLNQTDETSDSKMNNLQKIMLGFAADNGFQLYPNAYVARTDMAENISAVMNFGAFEPSQMDVFHNYNHSWDFNRLASNAYQFNENKFQSLLSRSNYKTSVYQSRYVDLCRHYGEMSVDRCLMKVNMPADVDLLLKSSADKQSVLLAQWLESTGLIEGSGKFYRNVLGAVVDTSGISDDGYSKLYVLNSLEALDFAAKDIAEDKGNGLYQLVIDLPADMFIYNEFCMLKPKTQWMTMISPSWEKNTQENQQKRLEAYAEQYSCLWGKLQAFVDSLKNSNNYQNTVIILQGVSAPLDGNNAAKKDVTTRFGSQQNVFFAIYDPLNQNLVPDMRLCGSGELLYGYLYNKNKCSKFTGLSYKAEDLKSLEALDRLSISADSVSEAQKFYNHWYKYWQKASVEDLAQSKVQKTVKTPEPAKAKAQTKALPQIEKTQRVSEVKTPNQVVDEGKEAPVKSIAQTAQEIETQQEKTATEGPENLVPSETDTSENEAKE